MPLMPIAIARNFVFFSGSDSSAAAWESAAASSSTSDSRIPLERAASLGNQAISRPPAMAYCRRRLSPRQSAGDLDPLAALLARGARKAPAHLRSPARARRPRGRHCPEGGSGEDPWPSLLAQG